MEIRHLSPSELDLVAPVWASLLAHHGELDPDLPTRPAAESWPLRRRDYGRWLAESDSFALVAEDGQEVVGYAVVHVGGPDETWVTSDRTAELETLAVLPSHRGTGLGGALVDAVEEELGRLGVEDMWVGVVAANSDALRFYERRGLRTYMHRMHARLRVGGDG